MLRDWLTGAGIGALAASELLHAVGEVTSNAIEHGARLDPARRVALVAEQGPGRVRAEVTTMANGSSPP
jgi:anti-sigma regulatory factor (Ser/Thr protein kinase)